jgi:predicted RNase H-like nuclease (RuvC/YqgF family)
MEKENMKETLYCEEKVSGDEIKKIKETIEKHNKAMKILSDDIEKQSSIEYSIEKIENLIEDLYDLRKESISKDGEYGLGNLVFKEFRNLGYLDNLKELKNQLKTKKLSL